MAAALPWMSTKPTPDNVSNFAVGSSSSSLDDDDSTMTRIHGILDVLMKLSCEQRRYVLSQPSVDGNSTLDDLIRNFLPWSMTQGCEESHVALPENRHNKSSASDGGNPLERSMEFRVHQALLLYIPMIIFTIGVLGNIMSFSVLTSRRMRSVSAYTYLAVLAVADNLVLTVGLLPVWIERLTGSDVKNRAAWLCRLISVVGVTVSDYSVWLIVAVTVERYIVVCHPLRAATLCQRRTALRVAAIIFVLVLTINANLTWTMDLRLPNEASSPDIGTHYIISVSFILISFGINLFNIFIGISLSFGVLVLFNSQCSTKHFVRCSK